MTLLQPATEERTVSTRFLRGDRVRIRDERGYVLCDGIALHTRTIFGSAAFQVWIDYGSEGWARDFNLNYVRVEVLNTW